MNISSSLDSDPHASSLQPTPDWRANPDFRGTLQILLTCFSTLVVCVWGSVHVDIPIRRARWSNGLNKLGWLVIGIVAPDLLLYVSCCQLYHAHALLGEARRYIDAKPAARRRSWLYTSSDYIPWLRMGRKSSISHTLDTSDEDTLFEYKEKEKSPLPSPEIYEFLPDTASTLPVSPAAQFRQPWTIAHSFYAVMGGFVLKTTPMLGGETRFALTPSGIRFVLENAPELMPDLSKEEIQDKSRSDGLAKTLLIVQLLHFALTGVARLAQSLPLSLLEVFTMAHALCTVVTCVVWWKKPFGVPEPTFITGERADELAAYMLFTSPVHKDYVAGLVTRVCDSESSYVKVSPALSLAEKTQSHTYDLPREAHPGESFMIEGYRFELVNKGPDPHCDAVFGRTSLPWYNRPRGETNSVTISWGDMDRWTLAVRGLKRYGNTLLRHPQVLISRRSGLQMSVFLRAETWWWPAVPLAIATAYGLVHLCAWGAEFPTMVERMLWRYAAAVLIAVGVAFCQYSFFSARGDSGVSRWVLNVFLLLRPLASAYLLFESLRQLLFLPDRSFLLPNFSFYLPHVS